MGNIVEACTGCVKIVDGNCSVYPNPAVVMRWKDQQSKIGCAFNAKSEEKSKSKVRVGQQKQKKKK